MLILLPEELSIFEMILIELKASIKIIDHVRIDRWGLWDENNESV